jgi:ribosomal protein S18 acetylase RimI-like enzyme
LLTVRDAVDADLDAVAALRVLGWDDAYRPLIGDEVIRPLLDVARHRLDIERVLSEGTGLLLIAEENRRELVGFSLGHMDGSGEPYLESLHVRPGRRDRGIGVTLLRATAERWLAAGHRTLSLKVIAGNVAAMRFYERYGAEAAGTVVQDWNGKPVESVIYRWLDLTMLPPA